MAFLILFLGEEGRLVQRWQTAFEAGPSLRFGMARFFLVGKSIELAVTKLGRGAVALGGVG